MHLRARWGRVGRAWEGEDAVLPLGERSQLQLPLAAHLMMTCEVLRRES